MDELKQYLDTSQAKRQQLTNSANLVLGAVLRAEVSKLRPQTRTHTRRRKSVRQIRHGLDILPVVSRKLVISKNVLKRPSLVQARRASLVN